MRVDVFQHVPFEGLGSMAAWFARRCAEVAWTRLHAGDAPPRVPGGDLLVVLGGPMGVHDEAVFPWLAAEKASIAAAIGAGRRVLGVCLGAQLIAAALGARVGRGPRREVGWFPVRRTGAAARAPLAAAIPDGALVFHWHGDTFEAPPGAEVFMESDACAAQAFQLGPRVLGLQFHLETTPSAARALADNCPGDLAPGPSVQAVADILRDDGRFAAANAWGERVLDALAQA